MALPPDSALTVAEDLDDLGARRVEHENIVLKSSSGAVIRPGFAYGGKKPPLAA
jgi:hypothetical protein